jgi:DNA-binding MarR family transcriptional regulator
MPRTTSRDPRNGVAWLLAQLGAHAAEQFALRLTEQDLTPPLAGIMRLLRVEPGLSQQQLAERLAVAPSRVVGYVDDLEARGWLRRTRDTNDRRINVLELTPTGAAAFGSLAEIAQAHDRAITGSLTKSEYATLQGLLGRLVTDNGLTPGVHPGYRFSG